MGFSDFSDVLTRERGFPDFVDGLNARARRDVLICPTDVLDAKRRNLNARAHHSGAPAGIERDRMLTRARFEVVTIRHGAALRASVRDMGCAEGLARFGDHHARALDPLGACSAWCSYCSTSWCRTWSTPCSWRNPCSTADRSPREGRVTRRASSGCSGSSVA